MCVYICIYIYMYMYMYMYMYIYEQRLSDGWKQTSFFFKPTLI